MYRRARKAVAAGDFFQLIPLSCIACAVPEVLHDRILDGDVYKRQFFHCNIKSLNLLCNVMTAQRAHRAGCTETVFHRGEIVTECAHSNISVLKDGVLYSHPNDEFILRGIAKSHMIRVCYRLDIPVLEKPFTMDFLKSADEILVTSTTKFCLSADRCV